MARGTFGNFLRRVLLRELAQALAAPSREAAVFGVVYGEKTGSAP
jgi:hypothetical protein